MTLKTPKSEDKIMSQNDDSDPPELEPGRHGYRKGDVMVIGAGTGGRSMIAERLARQMIEHGHNFQVIGLEEPEPIHIPESLTDLPAHFTGKSHKPKKRRLKRKPGGKL